MRIIAKLLLLSLEEDEEVVLNASKRLVYRGEKEVNITFTEFEILHLLARNSGRVFSKERQKVQYRILPWNFR